MDKYKEQTIVEEVMNPYINTAQNTLRNSLPYHDHIYVSNCSFNETTTKILKLEAEGRFDNIKQKFSNILPHSRIINNNSYSQIVKPMYPQNQQNHKHTYPPTQRSINQRLQTIRPNTQQYYRQQYPNPNNVFRPQHQYFKQNLSQKPVQKLVNETEDVSMRTAPQLRPGQINLGRGMIAEEVFHHEHESELNYEEYFQYPHEYSILIINSYPPKRLRRVVFESAPYKKAKYEKGICYFYIPPIDQEDSIREYMLEYLNKEKYAFIIPNDELYCKISEVYRKYFDQTKFKPVRYTKTIDIKKLFMMENNPFVKDLDTLRVAYNKQISITDETLEEYNKQIANITKIQKEINSQFLGVFNNKIQQNVGITLLLQAQTLEKGAERLTTAITFAEHKMYHYSILQSHILEETLLNIPKEVVISNNINDVEPIITVDIKRKVYKARKIVPIIHNNFSCSYPIMRKVTLAYNDEEIYEINDCLDLNNLICKGSLVETKTCETEILYKMESDKCQTVSIKCPLEQISQISPKAIYMYFNKTTETTKGPYINIQGLFNTMDFKFGGG
ncbi:unnamed protein product [Leptidea sinapis]|uniref:Uncharacterized protein n=1 Tax=Leptidea sinapis TaxID=189913 RepID=A0A5E4PZ36_9NEOP|nr:unnamed protein product [Leptidea sinapis]